MYEQQKNKMFDTFFYVVNHDSITVCPVGRSVAFLCFCVSVSQRAEIYDLCWDFCDSL